MMLTLLAFQLAFPAGYAIAKGLHAQGRVSARRLETLVDRSIQPEPSPSPSPEPEPGSTPTIA